MPSGNTELNNQEIIDLVKLIKANRLGEAETQLNRLEETRPRSSTLRSLRGTILLIRNDVEKAIKQFKEAIELNPDRREAYYDLGTAFEREMNYHEAIKNYIRCLEFDGSNVAALNATANALIELGDFEQAESYLIKAENLQQAQSITFNNLGNLKKRQEDYPSAIEYFKKSIDADPNCIPAIKNLAACHFHIKNFEKSYELYQRCDGSYALAKSLECLLHAGRENEFFEKIKLIAVKNPTDLRIAALSAFASNRHSVFDTYPFCPNPLDYLHISNLRTYMQKPAIFLEQILSEMNHQSEIWEPKHKTTKGGFQTASDLFKRDSDYLATLQKIITKEIHHYINRFKHSECLLIKQIPEKAQLNGWFVRLLQSGHQDSHIHPDGWISGVVYLKTISEPVDHEGAIEFGLHGYTYPEQNNSSPKITWLPNDGDIVLFPSSLFHKTVPVKQNSERCVIAFDLCPLK